MLSSFIPDKTIIIDDNDFPCFSTKIRFLLQEKNIIYKNFCKDRHNAQLLRKLEHLHNRLNNSIDSVKKMFKNWSLVKSFLRDKKSQSSQQFYTIMHL